MGLNGPIKWQEFALITTFTQNSFVLSKLEMVVLFMLRLKCGSVLQFSYRGNKAQLSSVSEKLEIQNVYGCLFQFSTENWFDILLVIFVYMLDCNTRDS